MHARTLSLCEWCSTEGAGMAVVEAAILFFCGAVFGSVRVTLPAPHPCGDA